MITEKSKIEELTVYALDNYKLSDGYTPSRLFFAYLLSKGVNIVNEDTFIENFSHLIDVKLGENNTKLFCLKPMPLIDSRQDQDQEDKDLKVTEIEKNSEDNTEIVNELDIEQPTASIAVSRNPYPNYNKPRNVKPRSNSQRSALLEWASLQDISDTIQKLQNIALPETWNYGGKSNSKKFPILSSYLFYTFYRLQQEKNKIIYNDKYAVFNTGLVDKRYEPIYALFAKNKFQSNREWYFIDFCIAGEERSGKTLVNHFNPLPKRANYFDKVSDMLYDVSSGSPKVDYQHVIIENTMRLPYDFLLENIPDRFRVQDITKMHMLQKKDYFKKFGRAIEEDNKVYRFIKSRVDDAIRLALKRIEWNFKTAIPMYYPTFNVMSLLLPLALKDEERVDAALVVEKTPVENYLGHTILPLDLAYSNARLVCRPDSDWLVAEKIQQELEMSDEEDA